MANDYLRYKYFLITRIPGNELFTAIKRIIMSGEVNTKGTILEAVNSEAFIKLASDFNITSKVMAAILTAITSDNTLQVYNDIFVFETVKTAVNSEIETPLIVIPKTVQGDNTAGNIQIDGVFISVPKKAISKRTAVKTTGYCKVFTKPIVIPKTFVTGLVLSFVSKFTTKSKISNTIKKAARIIVKQNTFVELNIATIKHTGVDIFNNITVKIPLQVVNSKHTIVNSISHTTIETLLQIFNSISNEVSSISQSSILVIASKDTAINIQHKQNNAFQFRTTIMVFGRAHLVDYAQYSLQQLNLRTLKEMKHKGE